MGCCHVASVVLKLRKINTEADVFAVFQYFQCIFGHDEGGGTSLVYIPIPKIVSTVKG